MTPQINAIILLTEKIFAVSGAVIYLIFAIVIVKQVLIMSKNVQDKFNDILIVFSYLHLLFSIALVLLTLII